MTSDFDRKILVLTFIYFFFSFDIILTLTAAHDDSRYCKPFVSENVSVFVFSHFFVCFSSFSICSPLYCGLGHIFQTNIKKLVIKKSRNSKEHNSNTFLQNQCYHATFISWPAVQSYTGETRRSSTLLQNTTVLKDMEHPRHPLLQPLVLSSIAEQGMLDGVNVV